MLQWEESQSFQCFHRQAEGGWGDRAGWGKIFCTTKFFGSENAGCIWEHSAVGGYWFCNFQSLFCKLCVMSFMFYLSSLWSLVIICCKLPDKKWLCIIQFRTTGKQIPLYQQIRKSFMLNFWYQDILNFWYLRYLEYIGSHFSGIHKFHMPSVHNYYEQPLLKGNFSINSSF